MRRWLVGAVACAALLVGPTGAYAQGPRTVAAWGGNWSGQLGDGTTTDRHMPVAVTGFGSGVGADVKAIVASSAQHSLALTDDGQVWAWGDDSSDQLSWNSVTYPPPAPRYSTFPLRVNSGIPESADAVAIAGSYHALGVSWRRGGDSWLLGSTGQVQVWGSGSYGHLFRTVRQDAAAIAPNLVLQSDGSVWMRTWSSQHCPPYIVGCGPLVWSPVPGFGPGSGVTAIASNGWSGLSLKTDGSVWAFGDYVQQPSQPQVVFGPGSGVVAIARGEDHSLALKSDGSVWSWGYNFDGQLGDGTSVDRPTPVPVLGLGPGSGVTKIAAGYHHSLALKSDGTVWSWGNNSNGQLGDGTTTTRRTRVGVRLGLKSYASAISAGFNHSLAIVSLPRVFVLHLVDDQRPDIVSCSASPAGLQWRRASYSGQIGDKILWGHGRIGDECVPGYYDATGIAIAAVFRPSTAEWLIDGEPARQWGRPGDIPVPADYNGDGITDLAVFRPSKGEWLVEDQFAKELGQEGDVPVPADYDGDGRTDLAVFRPSTGEWEIEGQAVVRWGENEDVPVPADYDGDGRADVAVWRPSTGEWRVLGGTVTQLGQRGDTPLTADLDGDRIADLVVFRPTTGELLYADANSRAAR